MRRPKQFMLTVAVTAVLLWLLAGCADGDEQKAENAQQQEGAAQQQKAEDENLKPIAECVNRGGSHQRGALNGDSHSKKIVFVSTGTQTIFDIYTIESVTGVQPSIGLYGINTDGTGLTQLTRAAATRFGVHNGYPEGREVTIGWSADDRSISSIHFNLARSPQYGEDICSPDGKKLASVIEEASSTSASAGSAAPDPGTDIEVRNSTKTTNLGNKGNYSKESWPVFSPDSEKLAFVRERLTESGKSTDVYVANADGSDQTNLTHSASYAGTPVWLPDSKKLAFISGGHICTINADGTGLTHLTDKLAVYSGVLVLSPDHKKLAFLGDAPGGPSTANIYAINTDGTGLTPLAGQVTGKSVSVWILVPPFFSPDSKQIAFVLSRSVPLQPVTYDMYVVNVDGTGLIRLTNNKNAEGIITWARP